MTHILTLYILRYQNVCLHGDNEIFCCSPADYMASAEKPIEFISEFCGGAAKTSKVFKLLWTQSWAQICDLSMSIAPAGPNLYTLQGDEALSMATMIGGEHASGLFNFNKAFDSNKESDESSMFHSLNASPSNPQGVQITFDTVTRVHEVTINRIRTWLETLV